MDKDNARQVASNYKQTDKRPKYLKQIRKKYEEKWKSKLGRGYTKKNKKKKNEKAKE